MKTKVLKAYHHYKMRKSVCKNSSFIKEIYPITDRTVPETMFNLYDDTTELKEKGSYDEKKY